MLKILKICSLLILFLLFIYSVISSNSLLYLSVQLILITILIGIGISCFKKKEYYRGMLYVVIAMSNLSISIK
ncbi:hypothetical protein KS08_09950 [Bacillus subtilis]|nr:hypothetical protein BAMTA208_07235 [Bacillus amyloliquefaciens TA208]AEB63694.1 Uncharacterized protein yosU Flags: Precursor [Bacillus amyloliquefaciens LL3]AEK88609.1 hypothetical protein BAXH7_01471 [Bacillus amyloliquefaciens XH7]AIW33949.1 hypothetical protein KS08_09950 [Bacillus subtilis]QDP92347.1 hypothetical protein FOG69_09540 [Bacillus amyloliquefaciens]